MLLKRQCYTTSIFSKPLKATLLNIIISMTTTSLSREYLRSLAPKHEDVVNALVDSFLPNITEQAKKGLNEIEFTRQFCADSEVSAQLPPISHLTVTCEEFVENLRAKCGDCEITWEVRTWHDPAYRLQDITVRW